MMQPGRKHKNGDEYRYGFNGKEKSFEIANDDYDFGARIYDGRLGRWLSVDPLQARYPFASCYSYTLNNPIQFVDPDGKEIIINGTGITFFHAMLVKAFSGKISIASGKDASNSASQGTLRISLNVPESKLTETELKAYKEIKRMMESPHKIRINVSDKGFDFYQDENSGNYFSTESDVYETSTIYPKRMEKTHHPGFVECNSTGTMIMHFLLEQEYGQVNLKQTAGQMSDRTYDKSHNEALVKGEEIFGFSWSGIFGAINKSGEFDPKNPETRIFVIDKDIIQDGKYMGTIRELFDYTNPDKVKVTTLEFQRYGLKVGDSYVHPYGNRNFANEEDSDAQDKVTKQYFKDNPVKMPKASPTKSTKKNNRN